jgi:Zn-dependent M28 family amino/carboxypeptidase
LLPGSDPALADEVVVLTAHHDHIGIGTPVKGDAIYNGALDNAVGVSMLIEVAQAIAAAPQRPRRSILFVAVGAEEKGLIGSDYFAEYPTVARESMVANINLDGAFPFYDFRDIIAFGAEQSQLGERLAAAAGEIGLTVAADPFPEEGIFTRSDQYSFVKRGVPAVFLYNGFTNLEGRNVGRAVWDDVLARIVHEPGDDLSQPIDYRMVAKFADTFRRLTLVTANAPERPLWYRDSVFAKRFAPGVPTAERPRSP